IPDIERQYANRSGNPEELYRFEKDISFAEIARTMGCFGRRVEHAADIVPAIREAMQADAPAVVEVMTDFSARAPEPWTPA
ncbi:MAG: thiamine pyrophosphate-binding protein, partial [Anaerolineae bacterium]|nr:thiamine pyrophosphate-binding protein [Anaerolineae bacterium]